MSKTITTKFQIREGSEPMLMSILSRLTTVGGIPITFGKETIMPLKRNALQKISDWFSGTKQDEPKTLYRIEVEDIILIDGRLDAYELAYSLKRVVKRGETISLTIIDSSCNNEVTSYSITSECILKA